MLRAECVDTAGACLCVCVCVCADYIILIVESPNIEGECEGLDQAQRFDSDILASHSPLSLMFHHLMSPDVTLFDVALKPSRRGTVALSL